MFISTWLSVWDGKKLQFILWFLSVFISEVMTHQCFTREIRGCEVIIWPSPEAVTIMEAHGGLLVNRLEPQL